MMISHRDSNKRFKKNLAYIAGAALCIFLWSPFKAITVPFLESTGFFSSYLYTRVATSLNKIYFYSAANSALYEENILLQKQLEEEKMKYLELDILSNQIKKYDDLTVSSSQLIYAKRIGIVDTLIYDTFRIDKGESALIQKGQIVVGQHNTILGFVSEVGYRTSLVSLLWSGNEISGRTSASGTVITLKGIDDGVCASQIPHEMDFEVGDVILYDINPNLIIGVVKRVNDNEEDRFKEIIVNTPFHPSMIDVVGIESSI